MSAAIPYPALEQYLAHLCCTPRAGLRVWADDEGRAQGSYFNATLTSAFQAIRGVEDGRIVGYEGFARSYAGSSQGLCIWNLLDHAADDNESVELDRLCRMLHSINFFRQPAAGGSDLYLSVHARLLAAVECDHGSAFRRILARLALPQERVVLQLPAVDARQAWLVNEVAGNYQSNGFRIAVNVKDAAQGLVLLQRVRPEAIKVDARAIVHDRNAAKLMSECAQRGVRVMVKRVDSTSMLALLEFLDAIGGQTMLAQGFLWDLPQASLEAQEARHLVMLPASHTEINAESKVGVA